MIRIGTALVVAAFVLFFSLHFYAHHVWNAVPTGTTIDRIVVEKSARRLSIFANGRKLKTYRVALGPNPIGPKREEGDMNSRCTFLIRPMRTTPELPSAACRPDSTS